MCESRCPPETRTSRAARREPRASRAARFCDGRPSDRCVLPFFAEPPARRDAARTRVAPRAIDGLRPAAILHAVRAPAAIVPLLLATVLASGSAGAQELGAGSQAPPFALPGSDGEVHRLSDHVGERGVVLAWFPKAFTPG